MSHRDDPATWTEAERADVAEVVMQTVRDDIGIDYGVSVSLRSLAAHAYEDCEDRLRLWTTRVEFGADDAHCHGGAAFTAAARRQQALADKIAGTIWGGGR